MGESRSAKSVKSSRIIEGWNGLRGEQFFWNRLVAHAEYAVRDQRLNITHRMHGSAEVSPVVDKGVAGAAE